MPAKSEAERIADLEKTVKALQQEVASLRSTLEVLLTRHESALRDLQKHTQYKGPDWTFPPKVSLR